MQGCHSVRVALVLSLALLWITASCDSVYSQEAEAEPTMDRWDRVACLVSERAGAGGAKSFNLATAFFVATPDGFAIITAAHAAKETNPETKVAFRSVTGNVVGFLLREIQTPGHDPWTLHPSSDLAMIFMARDKLPGAVADVLTQTALPLESFANDEVERTTKIEIVGFPLGLGVETLSPLVMPGAISSKELLAKTTWGQEPIVFAVPTVGGGTSGGPVFMAQEDSNQVQIVGMYIGFMSDESGSKLSKLVPARVIREFISQTPE